MKLENQVCSLPLAQRLKELGVKQESLFVWAEDPRDIGLYAHDAKSLNGEKWAAFTVAELGEMLPAMCIEGEHRVAGDWVIDAFRATTEADARAKMLIYLIENNLIAP